MKSLAKPKGKQPTPQTPTARTDKELRREVEREDKAQCCAKRSKTTAGCHD